MTNALGQMRLVGVLTVLLVALSGPSRAQTPPGMNPGQLKIEDLAGTALVVSQLEPDEVVAYVLVVGDDGAGVAGLGAGDFSVFERSAANEAELHPVFPEFGSIRGDRRRTSVALTMDHSGSMYKNGDDGEKDVRNMIKANIMFVRALRQGVDHVSVIKFSSEAKTFYPDGDNMKAAERAIKRKVKPGKTAFLDALDLAIEEAGESGDMKMVMAFTDGKETASQRVKSPEEIIRKAQLAQVPLVTIGLGAEVDANLMGLLAAETGGFYLHVEDSDELPAQYEKAASLLQGAYMLRWKPTFPAGTETIAGIAVKGAAGQPIMTGIVYESGTRRTGKDEALMQALRAFQSSSAPPPTP